MAPSRILTPHDRPRRPTAQTLVTISDLRQHIDDEQRVISTIQGTLGNLAAGVTERQREIAQWGIEHLLLLRLLVRKGLIAEAEIGAERQALLEEVQAAAQAQPEASPDAANPEAATDPA